MGGVTRKPFNSAAFLATEGPGRKILNYTAKEILYPQGGPADAVYYLQTGRAKLTVVSKNGKEATVTLLAAGDFFGEESMAGAGTLRTVTASAIIACSVLKIATAEILRALRMEHQFSTFFLKFIVIRGMRTQADLIDQLFNSSERRLARTLLLMAEYGEPGAPETLIPPVTQETLADMIGATRSRVNFFMNRFRKLGYIDYNGGIRVHKSLLKVFLQDRLPEENTSRPKLLDPPRGAARTAKRAKLI
jgi:CRP/FNR family transcriptional regulator, cyclic AMP receptor protein